MRVLITGGAGFVGSYLAIRFKRDFPAADIVSFDNLRRRGAELNLPRLAEAGVRFVHGDVRSPGDLSQLGSGIDLLVDAAAEPSVHAGLDGSPQYVIETNLSGTVNCLELARRCGAAVIFLSTSRVYSIAPLREMRLKESPTRFEIEPEQEIPGVGEGGISEAFPTHLPRSLYGATKLASELIVQEYAHAFGLRAFIDRCGVIAGPGQFGKVDQGVFTLWVANHFYGKPLSYHGFGGEGKQVRDLLHPDDLFRLVRKQVDALDHARGEIYNVGGGLPHSASLQELTALCRDVVGREVPLTSVPDTAPVDVPVYLSDSTRVSAAFDWRPKHSPRDIVRDIFLWIQGNREELRSIFD